MDGFGFSLVRSALLFFCVLSAAVSVGLLASSAVLLGSRLKVLRAQILLFAEVGVSEKLFLLTLIHLTGS